MEGYIQYIVLGLIVFVMNVIPGFMPPTWSVLTFFRLKYGLMAIPLVIIGALAATLGRVSLAYLARTYFRRFLPKKQIKNLEVLSHTFEQHKRLTIPVIFAYAFLPIPSNQVYIAAGLGKFNIKFLAFCFFLGRLISYTFWVLAATHVANSLEDIFGRYYGRIGAFVSEFLGFGLLFLISKIDWQKIFTKKSKK